MSLLTRAQHVIHRCYRVIILTTRRMLHAVRDGEPLEGGATSPLVPGGSAAQRRWTGCLTCRLDGSCSQEEEEGYDSRGSEAALQVLGRAGASLDASLALPLLPTLAELGGPRFADPTSGPHLQPNPSFLVLSPA